MANEPPIHLIRRYDTHRLIPCKYRPDGSNPLSRISEDEDHLQQLLDLGQATNERAWAENRLMPGISSDELVFGVPNHQVINAAFTHPHPLGSRFNGPDRGAWYAGFALGTAQAEVAFHKSTEYAEIGRFEDTVTYDDYLADFSGSFHDLRNLPGFGDVLAPDSYLTSQALSDRLLDANSLGIVYPSVRDTGGTCLACFRPACAANVRKDAQFGFTWDGSPVPSIKRINNLSLA